MEQGKTCAKCREQKVFGEFSKDKYTRDGFAIYCKKCLKQFREQKKLDKDYYQESKEYKKQYYQENKERLKEQRKQYYQENKEQSMAYEKQYRQENAEQRKVYEKQYRQENAERYKEHVKKYRQTEKGRETKYRDNMKRRSHKQKIDFTPHERKQILDRDKWKCQSCGIKVHDRSTGNWNTPDKAHVDHIIPIIKSGHSEPSNLQTLCRTCNLSKAAKIEQQLSLF